MPLRLGPLLAQARQLVYDADKADASGVQHLGPFQEAAAAERVASLRPLMHRWVRWGRGQQGALGSIG